jgi:ubiquitin-protein ligase
MCIRPGRRKGNVEMLRRKRGSEELIEEECHLTEQIKKFRITSTPGDLRLQNDILDFQKIPSIRIETIEKSCIVLTFTDIPPDCPHSFHIRVPKLYPHDPPQVTCLNPGFLCQHIDANGKVHHPALGGNWTAINSLVDVAQILQEISSKIYQASLGMEECGPFSESRV